MNNWLRFAFMLLFSASCSLNAQYLYFEDFEDITDWTVTPGTNNNWINTIGDDSLYGPYGKFIFVSCNTCNNNPQYYIALSPNQTYISLNSSINIPSTNYKIELDYYDVTRPSDDLKLEYSYDNTNWSTLSTFSMTTKWKRVSFPVTDLSGFTPGANVYFRFFFDIGTILPPNYRYSCGIDNFAIVRNDWDITNLSTVLSLNNNTVLYIKNADYSANNTATLNNSGTIILDNGSDILSMGTYNPSSNDTIKFSGTNNQYFLSPVNSVGTFMVDKNSPTHIVMVDSFLQIQDRLHLSKGIVKTSAKRFPVNLANSSNPIASSDSYVDGKIKYAANITNRLFPTGNKGVYRPIILDNGNIPHTIRYVRQTTPSTPTYNAYNLDSVSTSGYWVIELENSGTPGVNKMTKLSFGTGDNVYTKDSTRVALSDIGENGPFDTDDAWTTTHTGTPSNGTVAANDAIAVPKYYARVGYSKDGRINLKAMLQGPLMDSTKVLWQDTDFSVSNWNVTAGDMHFQREADKTYLNNYFANKPWAAAFKGLAFVGLLSQENSWEHGFFLPGSSVATMNADVPLTFSSTETYYLEFDYLYDGNNGNKLYLMYSTDNGNTWNHMTLPSTNQKWELFRKELNSTNFPGFNPGVTPIRFGFRGQWGSPIIMDDSVPAPLIDNLRIKQKLSQPEEMTTYLSTAYILDSLIGTNHIPSLHPTPQGAVDLITIYLRNNNTTSYTVLDSQIVWLMKDGTIKSLAGKNYLKFAHTNSGSGYFVVKHRNHLPVMSANSISFSPTTETTVIDFTDINNIKDATAYQYASSPDKYALYLGNATEDFPNGDYYETNATDYFIVSAKNNTIPDRGFYREDINMDGYVNSEDFNLVQIGNNNLYFSTVPEP